MHLHSKDVVTLSNVFLPFIISTIYASHWLYLILVYVSFFLISFILNEFSLFPTSISKTHYLLISFFIHELHLLPLVILDILVVPAKIFFNKFSHCINEFSLFPTSISKTHYLLISFFIHELHLLPLVILDILVVPAKIFFNKFPHCFLVLI